MTEKKDMPRHDLKLDRLSEREKVNVIIYITASGFHATFPF